MPAYHQYSAIILSEWLIALHANVTSHKGTVIDLNYLTNFFNSSRSCRILPFLSVEIKGKLVTLCNCYWRSWSAYFRSITVPYCDVIFTCNDISRSLKTMANTDDRRAWQTTGPWSTGNADVYVKREDQYDLFGMEWRYPLFCLSETYRLDLAQWTKFPKFIIEKQGPILLMFLSLVKKKAWIYVYSWLA